MQGLYGRGYEGGSDRIHTQQVCLEPSCMAHIPMRHWTPALLRQPTADRNMHGVSRIRSPARKCIRGFGTTETFSLQWVQDAKAAFTSSLTL